MGIVTTYNFDNAANYTLVDAEVTGGYGQPAQSPAGQSFQQDFSSDTGFTYDSVLVEFLAGVLTQKSQFSSEVNFYANYASSIDGDFGVGVLTGTAVNGASAVGGKLDLSGGGQKNVTYAYFGGTGGENGRQVGAIRFKFTKKGAQSGHWMFYSDGQAVGSLNNELVLYQHSNGSLIFEMATAAGSIIFTHNMGTKTWVTDQEYEIEMNWDLNTGAHRLFIDGVQHGSTGTTTGTRSTDINFSVLGRGIFSSRNSNYLIDDVQFFNAVQHTADYTPVTVFQFGEVAIQLPDFAYSGIGSIQSLTDFTTTETGSVRYVLEGKYWNGSAWVSSDSSYAQASDKATIVTNLASLDVTGQTAISVTAIFPDGTSAATLDILDIDYSGQQVPTESSLLTNNSFVARDFSAVFTVLGNTPANSAIQYAINVNGQDRYYNGSAWVDSDGTFTQSSTATQIKDNIANLLTENSTIKIKVLLQSSDNTALPQIDSITVSYDFGAATPTLPVQCQVYGFLRDAENQPIVGAVLTVKPSREATEYAEAESRIIGGSVQKTSAADGFFAFNLIASSEFEAGDAPDFQYALTIQLPNEGALIAENSGQEILFTVPDLASVNITDRITGA